MHCSETIRVKEKTRASIWKNGTSFVRASVGISKSKKRNPQLINWSSNRIYIFISRFSVLTDVNDSFSARSYGFIPISLLCFTRLNRTPKRASDRR